MSCYLAQFRLKQKYPTFYKYPNKSQTKTQTQTKQNKSQKNQKMQKNHNPTIPKIEKNKSTTNHNIKKQSHQASIFSSLKICNVMRKHQQYIYIYEEEYDWMLFINIVEQFYAVIIGFMQIEISSKGYFQTISEFKIIKDIGVGSFGKVKLAVHRGTRRHFAIKIIDLNANLSETEIQIILREIKIHFKLDHPHIIKLWDTLLQDNKIFMIMDYAKNGSLFRFHSGLLQCGSEPSPAQIYQFFYQTLQAVRYLHTNDLMHRDIKPENLLLDQDFNIKLCDFGWATNQITSSRTTFCGTYEYMAPEMVLEKSYDYRIDIWALGILLFELAHGKAPFQAQSLKIMKQKINKGAYEIDSNCEPSMKELIVDILQFLPEKRLGIEAIQKHPWVKANMGMAIGQENLNSSLKNTKQGINKKHQHQKSLGNFQSEAYKNYFNDSFHEPPKHKINIFDFEMNPNLHLAHPKVQIKKHKRNVTQPDTNQIFQRQENQSEGPIFGGLGKKIMQMNMYTGEGEQSTSPTPYDSNYLLQNNQKQKMKCKTQSDKELSKLDAHILMSRKNTIDSDELGLKKKKTNMLTQMVQTFGGHMRNYSNVIGNGKQNDLLSSDQRQKTKKKQKVTSSKVKRIDDRYLEISCKPTLEKSREIDKLYLT